MSKKRTRILAAISDHWLLGDLALQDSRIREELNDSGTDFVHLHDVEVHAHARRECVAKLPTMVLSKSKLEFIVAPLVPHEAPEKRWNNVTAKATHAAFAIVSEYRIHGTLHLSKSALDPHRALTQQDDNFFALTQVSLGYGGRGVQQLSVPLLLVNKNCVSCLNVGDNIQPEIPAMAEGATPDSQGGPLEEESLATLLENVHGLLTLPNGQAELMPTLPEG